ncbi:unnamed protein product [Clonostachys rosea]|uniref:Major facilitator superfamily (MFS) profile domain-containing protein n=1 Tax=Bionectria ochroleuca TaxID=29856 RepID=A0ABY6UXA0_BIOOC|nr:unnamed protein product [Clonostachys rosea]
MASTSTELQPVGASTDRTDGAEINGNDFAVGQEFCLPPVDRGKDAWLFLGAAFLVDCFVWGFPFAFGVFQDYYRTHEPFAGSGQTTAVGTCAMGIMYLGCPVIMAFIRYYPKESRFSPFFGLVVMSCCLVASSYSTTITHLILSQGVGYALGGTICFCPCVVYVEEWFVKRKGFAYGVMWAGTGTGGCTIPLLLEFLLNRYGFRFTLRLWSGLIFALVAPFLYFLKPRIKSSPARRSRRIDFGFLFHPTFLVYQLPSIVQAFGFFLPTLWLPSYVRDVFGASSFQAALIVVALNVAAVVGNVIMGWLVDRLHVSTCIMISTLGAVLSTFLIWGLAANLGMIYAFCLIYGLFAGSYTATWAGVMRLMSKPGGSSEQAGTGPSGTVFDPIMMFSALEAGRGIGNLVSGPLSEGLNRGFPWEGQALAGYGSGYGALIVFTGVTALMGGSGSVARRIGLV